LQGRSDAREARAADLEFPHAREHAEGGKVSFTTLTFRRCGAALTLFVLRGRPLSVAQPTKDRAACLGGC
jgi:hypothetical protein